MNRLGNQVAVMRFVVVGGGVAGTSCALQLCKLCPDSSVTLVAPDATLKVIDYTDAALAESTSLCTYNGALTPATCRVFTQWITYLSAQRSTRVCC